MVKKEQSKNESCSGIVDGLTAKEAKAIEALLTASTIQKAAKTAGVSYTQLRRWLEQPVFAEAYRRARTVVFETTLAGLQSVTSDAIETLRTIMRDKSTAASVRVNAAGKLLDAGVRSRELLDTESRLAELEARFATMDQAKAK
ncbi:MAG: hypothetical protein SF097_04625 [Acidobacteriota bacterium]|nr:hypothetical protein [Acidobacteriota bacterium]